MEGGRDDGEGFPINNCSLFTLVTLPELDRASAGLLADLRGQLGNLTLEELELVPELQGVREVYSQFNFAPRDSGSSNKAGADASSLGEVAGGGCSISPTVCTSTPLNRNGQSGLESQGTSPLDSLMPEMAAGSSVGPDGAPSVGSSSEIHKVDGPMVPPTPRRPQVIGDSPVLGPGGSFDWGRSGKVGHGQSPTARAQQGSPVDAQQEFHSVSQPSQPPAPQGTSTIQQSQPHALQGSFTIQPGQLPAPQGFFPILYFPSAAAQQGPHITPIQGFYSVPQPGAHPDLLPGQSSVPPVPYQGYLQGPAQATLGGIQQGPHPKGTGDQSYPSCAELGPGTSCNSLRVQQGSFPGTPFNTPQSSGGTDWTPVSVQPNTSHPTLQCGSSQGLQQGCQWGARPSQQPEGWGNAPSAHKTAAIDEPSRARLGAKGRLEPLFQQLPKELRFNGKGNWRRFLRLFSKVADEYDWTGPERISQLEWALEGSPRDYLDYLTEGNLGGDYVTIIDKLNKRYGDLDPSGSAWIQLHSIRQGADESLTDYADRVICLFCKAYGSAKVPERQLALSLCYGCSDLEAGRYALGLIPKTPDEALAHIRRHQAIFGPN